MKLTVKGKVREFDQPVYLKELVKEYKGTYYAALVNNRLRELSYRVSYDAEVEFLDYSFYDSTRIYATSMRFLVCMAAYRIYPEIQIKFSNSISMGIFGRGVNKTITKEMLDNIIKEMDKIISEDIDITRKQISIDAARDYYEKLGYLDKVNTLEYRHENVNIYKCDNYKNYMYGYMVPSTGYLKDYEIVYLNPGFLVQYPRREEKGEIPEFSDSPKFFNVLNKSENWAIDLGVDMIYKMNKCIESCDIQSFVKKCENRHDEQLEELSNMISSKKDIRLIAIAGPSSSGKTTFSKRLEIALKSKGLKPLMISIDNYYLPVEQAPLDEFGQPDLEHLHSLDLDLFNQNILDLISGKSVTLPYYDFKLKQRRMTDSFTIDESTPIIIEGIHALNNELSNSIPQNKKFKIYISPFTQINIDNNNPINLTDLRLLRRIVRDLQFRNTTPEETLDMWPSVRRGEYRWIYPHIEKGSHHFIQANRLLKFLKYFKAIDASYVPQNSLLREFIGGSIFEH